jgi:beta-glucosidase
VAYCAACCLLGGVCARGEPVLVPHVARMHPEQWPRLKAVPPPDPALEGRLSTLLARMTPEQKVGQLIQADIGSFTPADLKQYPLGSILNGGNSSPGGDKLAAAREWLALAERFYQASLSAPNSTGIPLLWGTDAVHGDNNVPGATLFPHNIGLGAMRDPPLLRRIGEITALEVRVTGLDWAFAPTLAVARDARWGRTYESYSEDPTLVQQCARAYIRGLQGDPGTPQFLDGAHVLATAKHFLGDGATENGTDEGDSRESETQLREIDAAPYQAALGVGVQTVMASYSSWQGLKSHANRVLLTEVLKGRMGFEGLVIGDWDAHAQLPGCTSAHCPQAINAGIDVLMAPDNWRALYANTLEDVRAGRIPAARLDDAVRRVLRVKLRLGLDREGPPSQRRYAGQFELLGSDEHRAIARQAVRESIVLLKNHNHLLPLPARAHVLVAGEGADSIRRQSGGWTIDWQGTEPNAAFPHAESIFAAIARYVRAHGGSAVLSEAGQFTERPDVAIVVFGEAPYAEYRGDLATLAYSPKDPRALELLRRLKGQGLPVVTIFLSGRTLSVNAELNAADAFVAAWLPGTEGGGIADVLFRSAQGAVRYDFRGRLPFAWPRTAHPPALRERAGEPPLFPRGYGLRYADAGELAPLPEQDAPDAAPAR